MRGAALSIVSRSDAQGNGRPPLTARTDTTDTDRADRRPGRLILCATPIGNLRDITLRALDVLAAADIVACEDTRRTGKLLDHYDIDARLLSFGAHNEGGRTAEVIDRLTSGETVVLVSDAGTPVLSDPGSRLVAEAISKGIDVEAVPGPSAVTAAVTLAGVRAPKWCFVGFLPRKKSERLNLWNAHAETIVAFESPRRIARAISELADVDPARPVVVFRELTKIHEEAVRGRALDVALDLSAREEIRGEVTVVVGAASRREDDSDAAALMASFSELVESGARPRRVARALARLSSTTANGLYARWVEQR